MALENVASKNLVLAYSEGGYSGSVTLSGVSSQTFTAYNGSSPKSVTITLTYDQYSKIDSTFYPLEEIKIGQVVKVTGSSNVKDLQTGKKWIKASDFYNTVFTVTSTTYPIQSVKID